MKKFNQYILTHFPLIWNTRFHIMLPLLLAVNGLFCFAGFQINYTLQTLHEWHYRSDVTANCIAVLTGVVLLIIWLLFYFRQNAFKKLLPLSRMHLAKEFLIILLVITGLCSFMLSYEAGGKLKLRAISKSVNINKEKETVALALHFLPFSADDFSNDNQEFSYLNYNRHHSYYNYKDLSSYVDSVINSKAERLLLTNDKDGIKKAINQYLVLCKKYGAEYNIDVTRHVNAIFSTPGFKIAGTMIATGKGYDNKYYIEKYAVENAISRIEDSGMSVDKEVWYLFYYAIMFLSIGVFSFRITAIKTWLTGVVIFIILAILVTLFAIASDFKETGIFGSLLFLAVTAFVIALINILSGRHKLAGGVSYLLFLWFLPAFVMTIYGLLTKVFRYSYYEDGGYSLPGESTYTWLRDNPVTCNVIGGVFTLLMLFFVMIPLIKKWQANPQE